MTTQRFHQPVSIAILIFLTVILASCTLRSFEATPVTGTTPVVTAMPTKRPSATPFPTFTPWPTKTPEVTTAVDLIIAKQADPVPVAVVGADGTLLVGNDGYPWWNDAVFYEIFVRSFYDSNSDGIGDLQGLIQKLDYLNDGNPNTSEDLGVTGIWLMPVMASPSYHGYDITDYYTIEPDYGTNEDFLRLIDEAHVRGIHVIVDLVLNHTSAQHPWFMDGQNSDSPYRDWYLWSDSAGMRGWHETPDGYYFGIFWDQMPDLNYKNPDVTNEIYNVIEFWLEDMHVDGFRLDAIKHLIEDGNELENTPQTHTWLQDFYATYKTIRPEAFTVGEVWSPTADIVHYVGNEVDVCFEFDLAEAILSTAFSGRKSSLITRQENVLASYPDGQFATFLANHDQSRARSRLVNDGQAKVAASLQLTFPGIPFLYYGEEIGMQGAKPDENIRRPMQWDSGGGFTTASPWNPYFADYEDRNVAAQQSDTTSLLQHYDFLIQLRNEHEALRTGKWRSVGTDRGQLISLIRESDEEILLIVINSGNEAISGYSLSLESGPFSADLIPASLTGDKTVYQPAVNSEGGFDAYRPVDFIPDYGIIVLQFLK